MDPLKGHPRVKVEDLRESRNWPEVTQCLVAEPDLESGSFGCFSDASSEKLHLFKVQRDSAGISQGKAPSLQTQNRIFWWHWVVTGQRCLFWFPNQCLTTLSVLQFRQSHSPPTPYPLPLKSSEEVGARQNQSSSEEGQGWGPQARGSGLG